MMQNTLSPEEADLLQQLKYEKERLQAQQKEYLLSAFQEIEKDEKIIELNDALEELNDRKNLLKEELFKTSDFLAFAPENERDDILDNIHGLQEEINEIKERKHELKQKREDLINTILDTVRKADYFKAIKGEIGIINVKIAPLTSKAKNIDEGIYNQYYLGISAGTKGSVAEFGEMVGALGQLTMDEGRIEMDTSCKTRCLTSYRQGELDASANGYINANFSTGLRADQKFTIHKVQRTSGMDTATKTPEAGAIQRELSTTLSKYLVESSALVSQTNYLLQYLVGEDGFGTTTTFPLYGASVPFDPTTVADITNYELGWRRLADGNWYHEHRVGDETYYVQY
jgi:hypothetical protein